jgi:hypothetical protein
MIGKPKKNRPTARGSAARRASANGAPRSGAHETHSDLRDGKPPRRPAATRHKGRWCGWELTQLEALFGTRDDGSVARMLDRPIRSVRAQARTVFGAKPSRAGKPWVCDEDQRLRSCLGVSSLAVISLVLRRPVLEIVARVEELATKVRSGDWCSEEVKSLKCLYGSRDDAVLSVILSRPVEEIQEKASEHRLAKSNALLRRLADECTILTAPLVTSGFARSTFDGADGARRGAPGGATAGGATAGGGTASGATAGGATARGATAQGRLPRWTGDEVEALKTIYPHKFNVEIAKILRKSVKSIMSKAHDLGLRKSAELLVLMGKTNVEVRYARRRALSAPAP